MGLLRLALPAALLLYFLWKARVNPLFLLGIPVLMVMRGAVFFQNMKPFWMPGRLDPVTLLMAWLFLVWLVTLWNDRARRERQLQPPLKARLLPEELPLIGIAVLIGYQILRGFGESGDLGNAISLGHTFTYIVLGYVLVRMIVARASREETNEFLAAVVVVNTIAATLFIIHQGLHITIYEGASNSQYQFGGESITRATTFVPKFTLLALGYVLAKRSWSPKWLIVLGITLMSVLVSLTRTLLIAAVVGLIVAIIVRELHRPEAGRLVRRATLIVVCAAMAFLVFSTFRPTQYQFLLSRFGEVGSGGGVGQVQNWALRTGRIPVILDVLEKQGSVLFGIGFPANPANAVEAHIVNWTADMTWVPILYHFGYVGVFLFAALMAGFMARSLLLSFRPPELRRELGLAYFITLVLTLIMTAQQWTFMEPANYPMGLWVFALVAAEALRPQEEQVDALEPALERRTAEVGGPAGAAAPAHGFLSHDAAAKADGERSA